jgi:cytochrome c1
MPGETKRAVFAQPEWLRQVPTDRRLPEGARVVHTGCRKVLREYLPLKPVVPQTVAQYARDVTAFLAWAAEPHLEARKRMGFGVILFLLLLTGLLYFTKKRVWADVGGEIEDRPGVKTV